MAASGKPQRGQRRSAVGGPRLTRREVLAAAAGLALTGCASSTVTKRKATPTPTPFALGRVATLFVAGTVPPALVAPMRARLADIAGITEVTLAQALTTAPDLVLTFGALPAGYQGAPAGPSPLTILTHLRVPVDGVSVVVIQQEKSQQSPSGSVTWRYGPFELWINDGRLFLLEFGKVSQNLSTVRCWFYPNIDFSDLSFRVNYEGISRCDLGSSHFGQ